MIITLPINSKYLKNRYKMQSEDIERLFGRIFPSLIERFVMDGLIDRVDIFSDLDFRNELGFSSKINIIRSDTDKIITAEGVIKKYIEDSKCKQSTLVIYNPLFPFISIKKLHYLYKKVDCGEINSAFGSYFDALELSNFNELKIADRGIFSIINKEKFIELESRLIEPVDAVGLSALELISLRYKEDYQLYGLITNAGLM